MIRLPSFVLILLKVCRLAHLKKLSNMRYKDALLMIKIERTIILLPIMMDYWWIEYILISILDCCDIIRFIV